MDKLDKKFHDEAVNIKLSNFVVEVEGVKIAIDFIRDLLNPPEQSLFAFRRGVDGAMEISRFDNAESAAKFFEKSGSG